MNLFETKGVLAVLRAAYPGFYSGMLKDELYAIVRLWQRQFADDDGSAVLAAVEKLIATRTSNFPPVIGEVKQSLLTLLEPDEMTESEAWTLVAKACNTSNYRKSFDALPEAVKSAVGSVEQLKAWAMLPEDEFQTVVASNFQRSFRIYAQRVREQALLPESVKAVAAQIAGNFAPNKKLLEGDK